MKLHLPSLLRTALLACLSFPVTLHAATYMAEGVRQNDIHTSERFYDSGKGCYWRWTDTYGAFEKYKNYQFLGELYDRLPAAFQGTQGQYSDNAFQNLIDDSDHCWAYTASNMLQYWQTYYGVFSHKADTLPHGLNYSLSEMDLTGGTQSLKINMVFYDNWKNTAGNVAWCLPWYMSNDTDGAESLMRDGYASAGYFSEYYSASQWHYSASEITSGMSAKQFTEALARELGYERKADGTYELVTKGKLAYLGMRTLDRVLDGGHAITCYGFDTDAEGNIVSLQVVNSDDIEYKLFTLYVKNDPNGAGYILYSNKECTHVWEYAQEGWFVNWISSINTPAALQNMYAEYTSAETPLVWTGASSVWGGKADTFDANELPTASTGWQVYVDDGGAAHAGNYATYFDDGRKVSFGDVQGSSNISLERNISVADMRFTNTTTHYTFSGAGKQLTSTSISKTGAGNLTFNQVALQTGLVTLSGGRTELGAGTTLSGTALELKSGATLDFNGAGATLTSIIVNSGAALDFSARTSLTANSLTCLNGSALTFSVFSGGSTLFMGAGTLSIQGSLLLDLGETLAIGSYTLASADNIAMQDILNFTVGGAAWSTDSEQSLTLSLENNATQLVLHVAGGTSLTWKGGNGNWNMTEVNWQLQGGGDQAYKENAFVLFEGGAPASVSVSEAVEARTVTISGGQYSFSSADHLTISDSLRVQSSEGRGGIATFDKAPSLGENASISVADAASSLTISNGDLSVGDFSNHGTVTLSNGALIARKSIALGGTLSAASVTLAASSSNAFTQLVSSGAVTYSGDAGVLKVGDGSQMGSLSGGALELAGGSVSITGSTATRLASLSGVGNLTLGGALTLKEASSLEGNLTVSGLLSVGNSLNVTGSLAVDEIQLGLLADTPLLQLGSISGTAMNFSLSDAAEAALQSLSLISGQTCALAELRDGVGALALTIEGGTACKLGMYNYTISADTATNRVILTALLTDVEGWSSTDGVWNSAEDWSGKLPGENDVVALLGNGSTEVVLESPQTVSGMVVEHTRSESYRLTGESLDMETLNVRHGGLELANAQTSISGGIEVGHKGLLVVDVGSRLLADTMNVYGGQGLANAGEIVLSGALEAPNAWLINTGSLTVGAGDSAIGALVGSMRSGAGDFTVTAGGKVSIHGDSAMGLLTNAGEISMPGRTLMLHSATSAGGNLRVGQLGLAYGSNAFEKLEASSVSNNTGELTLGDGSEIQNSLMGGGSLLIHGQVRIGKVADSLKNLTLGSASILSTGADIVVKGSFSSQGALRAPGCVVRFNSPVAQGGELVARQLTLSGSSTNRFSAVTTSALTFVGPLSQGGALLSAGSLTAEGDSPIFISFEGTGAPAGNFTLIEADKALSASSFTLNPEFVASCLSADVQASLRSGEDGRIYLQMIGRDPNYYANHAGRGNGRAGAALFDTMRHVSYPAAGTDLRAVMDALEQSIAAGASAEQIDAMASAAVGASIPALSTALAGDASRQLRAIRNRTTTMGIDSRYEHPGLPYINAWINAEGDYRELDADGTASGYRLSSWGGSVGVDADVSENMTFGLACTALYGDFTAASADMAEGDMDTYYVTPFARLSLGRWTHTFVMTAGLSDISLERTVNYGGGSYTTCGETDGFALGALYEVAYTISLSEDNSTCWQPVANISFVHATVDAFTERGSDAALHADEQEFNQLSIGLGARLQAVVGENVYNRTSLLELRALVKADIADRKGEVNVAFASMPGYSAGLQSNDYGAVGVELGAGLTVPISANAGELFFDVSADLRPGQCEANGVAGWRVHF